MELNGYCAQISRKETKNRLVLMLSGFANVIGFEYMDVAFDPVKFGWLYLGTLFRVRRFSGVMYSSNEERLSRSRKQLDGI